MTKDPKDPDFAAIRERKEFKELLAELAEKKE